jgi:tetratricopeptide (TPR) repeat protein
MRSAFRITDNPLSTQGCSCGVSFAPKEFDDQKEKSSNDESKHDDKKKGGGSTSTKPLLAITLVGMIKNFFTFRPDLDDHPIKNKIKQAMLFRNRGEYDQALLILEELLEQVKAEKDEILITRAHYEIAYTYFMQDNLDKAEEFFRIVISRLVIN